MKLSVITPIYNTPDHLLIRMINSLQTQNNINYDDLELIIYNDGGEETPYLQETEYPFEVKYLFHPDNQGPGIARQKAIEHCSGDYIVFCDSDDYFIENELHNYWESFDNYCNNFQMIPDIIFPKRQIVSSSAQELWDNYEAVFPDNLHGLCLNIHFLKKNQITFLPQCFHEDGLFVLKCAMSNPHMAFIENATIVHEFRAGSISYFQQTRLYDISLLVSMVQLVQLFPEVLKNEEAFEYTAADENAHMRLSSCARILPERDDPDRYQDSHEYQATVLIANFAYNCLWNYLNGKQQYYIKTEINFYNSLTKEEIQDIYDKQLFQELDFLCEFDEKGKIKSYLRKSLEDLMNLYLNYSFGDATHCTIVIPTYNTPKDRLTELFSSLNEQNCPDLLEVLIVNDGSTEWVGDDFIHANLKLAHRIFTLEENKGVGYARQYGMDLVTTPYFFIMDADDELLGKEVLWHLIHWLDNHPDYFGVAGQERGLKGSAKDDNSTVLEYTIFEGKYEELKILHGLLGRTAVLREHNITFKPLQYAEDGLFVETLLSHQLKLTLLPFPAYDHKAGTLTNNVFGEFGGYNDLNDTYNLIRYQVKLLNNEKVNTIEVENFIYALLNNLEDEWFNNTEENSRFKTLHYYLGDDNSYWYVIHYFMFKIFSVIPIPILYKYNTLFSEQIQKNSNIINLIAKYLLYTNVDDIILFNPYELQVIKFNEIEPKIQTMITRRYEYFKQNKPELNIPHQIIKNFPWNYKED